MQECENARMGRRKEGKISDWEIELLRKNGNLFLL
jgi:hypothetical protein